MSPIPVPVAALHADLSSGAGRLAARRILAGCAVLRREGNTHRQQAITFAHLGKLNPISKVHLLDLVTVWRNLIAGVVAQQPAVVIGLTESGIIPSFTMYHACLEQGHAVQWLCTSRNRASELTFREPHSHAPVHYLPGELRGQCVGEIWIVEDEVTTGRTLLNLLDALRRQLSCAHYRIFTLLDARSAESRSSFTAGLRRRGLCGDMDAMVTIDPLPDTDPGLPNWAVCGGATERAEMGYAAGTGQLPTVRVVCGEDLATVLPRVMQDPAVRVQQATLSPWSIDGSHVRTRHSLPGNLYLYNQS